MPVGTLILEIIVYSFSLWLGAYLIARNPTKARLYLSGLGLVAYALALAVDAVRGVTLDPTLRGGAKTVQPSRGSDELSDAGRQALEWFRTQVPERTLYNWQTAAARLVAQDLREQNFSSQEGIHQVSHRMTER